MAGTAENSECQVVGWVYAFGERQANVQSDNSDPAAQVVSKRLLPNVRFWPKAAAGLINYREASIDPKQTAANCYMI
jgi:hypothetical protein